MFETAAGLVWPFRADLSLRELGFLALRLRNIDPTWRLPLTGAGAFDVRGLDAGDFALMLVAEGVPERDACRMAEITTRTLQRRQRPASEVLRQLDQAPDSPPQAAFQSGETATHGRTEGERSSEPDLSLERAA